MAMTPQELLQRARKRRISLLLDMASMASARSASPASLFAAGEQGVWYDPSDIRTMFQDSAGTTPVTAVGDPVGRILDKSGRGNHATQATAAARPVLQQDASGLFYLSFDGVDDNLATSSIDFGNTNKLTAFYGLRKTSDANQAMLAELSAIIASNNGSFNMNAPSAAATANLDARSKGTVGPAIAAATGIAAPITSVATHIVNIATDTCVLRVNGVQAATSAGDQGSGNFGNYPLYIGSRAGTILFFNGRLYSMIIRGAASSNEQIASMEAWVNAKTKAY